ncbi:MAG: hypothetical protein LLG04_14055 [Parachlamydia sp.]|nr:hypothetical protein [Parachlamydia sp.]
MIKLTVHPDSQQPPYCFEKAVVVIGSGPLAQADLAIPGENLKPQHVKIEEREGRFVVMNVANDPFTTLNGAPFAKRAIQNGDIIQIGETAIRFEGSSSSPQRQRELWVHSEEELREVLEKAMGAISTPQHASLAHQSEPLLAEDVDIERELERLSELVEDESEVEPPVVEYKAPQHEPPIRRSLKDFYLSDVEEDPEAKKEESKSPFSYEGMQWNWKLIASFISAILILALLLSLFFFFSTKAKIRDNELKVAEGLADISMALTYAQFNHIRPRNQNWTDPEFLKNNLISVLAAEYSPIISQDMQSLFNNANYILRIYNSSDLAHYVIIAQPAPSLSQWVLPKEALVVDSKAMELRKMKDLKSLNRLMLNPNPLDGSATSEVSQLIKQGELMPLAKLAGKTHRQGFNPPKALALLRPGAENLIYNAPRYYRFGEQFLKRAMGVAAVGNSDQISLLQEEIEGLSNYPDIVLYASQGMQWTVRAQKMLNSLSPNNKLLLAYLMLNSSGYVASSHLLMDEGKPTFALRDDPQPERLEPLENPSPEPAGVTTVQPTEPPAAAKEEIKEDALLEQLRQLSHARHQALQEVENDLLALWLDQDREEALALLSRMELLLKKHRDQYLGQPDKLRKQTAAIQFLSKLQQIVAQYDSLQKDQRDDLVATITRLYQEHPDMPFERFMDYVKEAGL